MERKLLSHDMTFSRIISAVLLILVPLLLIKASAPWWAPIIAVAIVGQMTVFIFYLPDTIEFDDNNMYIIRSNGEVSVDLRDIYKVKMVAFAVNRRYMWRIKYRVDGIEKTARFYPDSDRLMLDAFIAR